MSLLCNAFPSDNTLCVNTAEVITSNSKLSTSFVNTCSVITFKNNNINFMAHVDAISPNMENSIKKELDKLDLSNVLEVNIWKGSRCFNNCPSFEIVNNIINLYFKQKKINYYQNTKNNSIITS